MYRMLEGAKLLFDELKLKSDRFNLVMNNRNVKYDNLAIEEIDEIFERRLMNADQVENLIYAREISLKDKMEGSTAGVDIVMMNPFT